MNIPTRQSTDLRDPVLDAARRVMWAHYGSPRQRAEHDAAIAGMRRAFAKYARCLAAMRRAMQAVARQHAHDAALPD